MSRSRGVRWDGGAGGLAVAVEEVGVEELSAGQGQAGQEVSAGLEEPDGEAGTTRGLAEGQRGAGLEEPGGGAKRGAVLEEPDGGAWSSSSAGLADGGGRRSVFKLGVFMYFCTFSPGRRELPMTIISERRE